MPPPRTIKVGIPVSLSGQFQVQGRQALAGVQAWVEDVNRVGGLLVEERRGRVSISVLHYDDASRRDLVRRATQRLIVEDKVDLLLGPYSSVLAQAAAGVAEQHGWLLWNQGGAADSIHQQGYRWVVGILTPASEYLSGLAPLVREAAPEASTVAILRSASGAFPRAVSSGVERAAVALGFRTAFCQEYNPASPKFPQLLEAVEQVHPDVLVAVGRIQDDLRLAQLLARRRPSIGAVAVVAAPIQQFQDALGEEVEGFLGPSQWEVGTSRSRRVGMPLPNHYGPSAQQVLASLRRQGRDPVDYPMVQAYAAALVAQRCVEAAGTLDQGALREAAAALDFSTFYGRFKIDPATGRQIGHSAVIVQWQQDRKVIVWPPEQREGRLIYPWRGAV